VKKYERNKMDTAGASRRLIRKYADMKKWLRIGAFGKHQDEAVISLLNDQPSKLTKMYLSLFAGSCNF